MSAEPPYLAPRPQGHALSILVSGQGGTAIAMLAFGLAQQIDPGMAWATFAPSGSGPEREVRRLLARGDADPGVEQVPSEELEPHLATTGTLEELVVPESIPARMRIRLHEFLRLPPLLQRLAARSVPGSTPAAILLAHVESISPRLRHATLENADVHSILHREGVTLVVTYHGDPPTDLVRAFGRTYRVEGGGGRPWSEAVVVGESLEGRRSPSDPRTVAETWSALGLDPRFLTS